MNEPIHTHITLPRAWLYKLIKSTDEIHCDLHRRTDGAFYVNTDEWEKVICAILSEYERLKQTPVFIPNKMNVHAAYTHGE